MVLTLTGDRVHEVSWIRDGEKYALAGIHVKFDSQVPAGQIDKNLWLIDQPNFPITNTGANG